MQPYLNIGTFSGLISYQQARNLYCSELAGFHVICCSLVPRTKSQAQRTPPRQIVTAWIVGETIKMKSEKVMANIIFDVQSRENESTLLLLMRYLYNASQFLIYLV